MATNTTRSTAGTATSLTGRLDFGDQGVGAIPLDGDITLATEDGPPWQGKLSTNALEAAEQLWTHRQHARTLTEDEAFAITKVAFDVDLAFLGLTAHWDTARKILIADGAAIEVEATVRAAPPRDAHPKRRATVRLELTDGAANLADFTLTDASETHVYDREDLELPQPLAPGVDALAADALHILDESLTRRDLPTRAYWVLSYSEAPAWEHPTGTCGELSVWTVLPDTDSPA